MPLAKSNVRKISYVILGQRNASAGCAGKRGATAEEKLRSKDADRQSLFLFCDGGFDPGLCESSCQDVPIVLFHY